MAKNILPGSLLGIVKFYNSDGEEEDSDNRQAQEASDIYDEKKVASPL